MRSTHGFSIGISPSRVMPSVVKKATAAARSSTTTLTWSNLLIVMSLSIAEAVRAVQADRSRELDVERARLCLLWAHVGRRADHHPELGDERAVRHPLLDRLGDPEVDDRGHRLP